MKTIKYYLLFLCVAFCFIFSSCKKTHDGKIVTDKNGNVYRLDYRLGVTYAVEQLDKAALDSLYLKK